MGLSINLFSQQPSVLWCFPFLLLLSGCGETGPECGSPEARTSVIRSVADNKNNPLLNFVLGNSDSLEALLKNAGAEAEKTAILEKARQDAVYSLDDTIVSNARTARAASCTALLYVRVGDTTAEKEVEYRVEQAADGRLSVTVKPFVF